MPISWLSDIADHLKTLKQMNDIQTEEVFQIVGLLHGNEGHKESGSVATYDKPEDSNTTDDEKATVSGISQSYPQHTDHDFDGENYNPYQEEEVTETERGLQQYKDQALNGTTERNDDYDEGIYVITTSQNASKTQGPFQFKSQSQDKKEMSFSQRLENSQEVHLYERRHNQADNSKRVKSLTRRREPEDQARDKASNRRDRSHPSRNLDWSDSSQINRTQRVVETQRLDPQRRSLNIASHRWKDTALFSDNDARGRQTINSHTIVNPGKNYRGSIDMTATHGTHMVVGDASKRNELYSMLRDEVLGRIKQIEVSKNTILAMKSQLREKKAELGYQNHAYQLLHNEKESVVEINKNLTNDIKDLECQVEDLQNVVQNREASMENLKMQIEDFEKELLGLQDQMNHVMKLNAEIGMASEHWESSFHKLKAENAKESSALKSDFTLQLSKKVDKIQHLKRKLQIKDGQLKSLQQNLITAASYREEVESRRQAMVTVSVETEPAMELLEQHKKMLETKLDHVKNDIASVLDQVEREQLTVSGLQKQLKESKETNKMLTSELQISKSDLSETKKELEISQKKLAARLDEIKNMGEAMEEEQQQYREQMENAEQINVQLQQQVEQVTRAAEELQEHMNNHYQTNDSLAHNAEIQEQKINQLEEQLIYYQRQLKDKKLTIQRLEATVEVGRTGLNKRETRSVSVPGVRSKNSSGRSRNIQHNPFVTHLITDYSQKIPEIRHSNKTSASKGSCSDLIGGASIQKVEQKNQYANDDIDNTLRTSYSMFDATPNHDADNSGTFQLNKNKDQCQQALLKPPRNQKQSQMSRQQQQTSPQRFDTSQILGRTTLAGISTIMGTSQITTCCCGSSNCRNSSSQLNIRQKSDSRDNHQSTQKSKKQSQKSGRMTAIDDLQSSYAQFRLKKEMIKDSKKGSTKVLAMTEILVKFYLREAQIRIDSLKTSSCGKISQEGTLENLKQHVTNWSNHNRMSGKNALKDISEEQVREAHAFFKKRNPNVISDMLALLEHVGINDTQNSSSAQKTTGCKDPPQIVSNHPSETELTTDQSVEKLSSELRNQYGTIQNRPGMVNLLIQQQEYPIFENDNQEILLNSNRQPTFQKKHASPATTFPSLKSPTSSCRNCTATFNQTQSVANDMITHCKLLFTKFLQTGRSLAGICYGGCIFMGDQLKESERRNVDFALSYLSKDCSDFEGTSGRNLDELWGVVDGLLTCLSQIISGSCQQYLKRNNQSMDHKETQQAFDQIVQKSVELEMDYNHMISRERTSFDGESAKRTIDYPGPSHDRVSSIASSQMNNKLNELELRIKQKFSNIQQLESLLDGILGKQKDQTTLLPQLMGDITALQKVFLNIRRVVSKLKIELHQDYLFLGQVNLHFQTSRDHNSSIGTTFEMPTAHIQTQQSAGGTVQYGIHQRNMTGQHQNHTISQMEIGSRNLSSYGGPVTTRDPVISQTITQPGSSGNSHQPYFSPNQQPSNQVPLGLNIRVQRTVSHGTSPLPSYTGPRSNANLSSARFSNGSQLTSTLTARGPEMSNVDRIVEELQGLTFENSTGTTLVHHKTMQGGISSNRQQHN